MKIIIKHSTLNKVANTMKNMDVLMDSLLGTERTQSEHYADPVKGFRKMRKSLINGHEGKAFRYHNDPDAKETVIEINPGYIEDILDAAETFTTTVYTVAIPAANLYKNRILAINRKYKLLT